MLWRVQRVEGEVVDFLSENREIATRHPRSTIELKPGIGCACAALTRCSVR
jgi:hypothetical protein